MAADLERRGYIVYVTVSSADEEHIVQSESRADIKPLWLDLTTVSRLSEEAGIQKLIQTVLSHAVRNPSFAT